jgi:lysozyme
MLKKTGGCSMTMRMKIRTLVVFFVVASTPVLAQELADLDNDYSRQQLFSRVIAAEAPEPSDAVKFPIPPDFYFPNDAVFDSIANVERKDVVFGIDVSHHTDKKLDLSLLKMQKVDFVYAKATQGTGFKDSRFAYYWSSLAALPENKRPMRGAYHFLSAGVSGRDQADSFLRFVEANGGWKNDDLPPCLDLEWDVSSNSADRWQGISPDEILSNVKAWLTRVEERTGRIPMIYTARSWWKERGIAEARISEFERHPIWIADYSKSHKATEKPSLINGRQQHIWQFADNARLKLGYAGGTMDANIFYGSLKNLAEKYRK